MSRRRLALAAMVAAVAIVTLDTTILNVAIPTIRQDLHTSLTSLQWVIAGYSLTLGALLIIGGRIGDLVGTRRTFIAGAVLFACGSLLASIATSIPELVLGEAIIEGIGASLLFPASLATLSSRFEGPARAKAFALWGGVAGAAAALGPVIGGWLTSDYSWRWGFRINVVVAPLAALAALAALPRDERRQRRAHLDVRGALLLASGLFLVVFALTEAPDHGWFANRGAGLAVGSTTLWSQSWPISPVVAALDAAVLALATFARLEQRAARDLRDPLVDLRLFASRAFGGGLVTAAVVVMARPAPCSCWPCSSRPPTTSPQSPPGGGCSRSASAPSSAPRSAASSRPRQDRRSSCAPASSCSSPASCPPPRCCAPTSDGLPVGASLALFGLGAGMASSQLTNVILSEVGRERAGSASGVATTNNSLAAALGVAVLGGVLRLRTFADADSARWALLTAAMLLTAGAAMSFRIPAPRPAPGPRGGAPPFRGASCGDEGVEVAPRERT